MNLDFLKSILLGLFQGLTEFLPVSSSGHIMLMSEIFGLDMSGELLEVFTVILHMGTLLAVMLFYMKQVWELIAHPIKGNLKWLIVATIPTVVWALLLKKTGWDDVVDASARTLLPFAFLLTAVFLLLADGFARSRKIARTQHKRVKFKDALIMGLMQCVGTFSGVSRSGSTITGALASGLDSKNAADFSFMMSIPAILGAAALDAWGIVKGGSAVSMDMITANLGPIVAGVLAAFVSGLLAIKFMLFIIKKIQLKWFSLYLLVLAAVVLINDYVGSIW